MLNDSSLATDARQLDPPLTRSLARAMMHRARLFAQSLSQC